MKNKLLTAILTLTTISFSAFCTEALEGKPNKEALLVHLKNVQFQLQRHIKRQHEQFAAMSVLGECQEEHTFYLNVCDDFYNNSDILQNKLSEIVTPTFDLICTDMITLSDFNVDMFQRYTESTFDEATKAELRTQLEPIYTKHYTLYCKNNPDGELTTITLDELFEDVLDVIIYNDSLLTYEVKMILQKTEHKIKELENA